MTIKTGVSILILSILAGCASHPEKKAARSRTASVKQSPVAKGAVTARTPRSQPVTPPTRSLTVTNNNQVITLSGQSVGTVYSVNQAARFVILDFALDPLPPFDQRMNVYRQGVKVGELKITGPVMDGHIAADITAGDIQPGDRVRRD